jgi:hypothetical protein
MRINTLLLEAKDLARELNARQFQKRICCDPYDCMHHESCGDYDDGTQIYCGTCEEIQNLWIQFEIAANRANANSDDLLNAARRNVESERMDFYARAIEEGNEEATFWTDQE